MPVDSSNDGFLRLSEPVEISLDAVSESGSTAPFRAWVDAPATPAGELLLRGTLWRLDSGTLDAFSLLCPHEICEIERVVDGAVLPQQDAALPHRPLLACPCHFSVFDPEVRGERLVGPAPRGLYRFGFEIAGDRVKIDRVETALVDRFAIPEVTPGGPR